MSVFTGWEHGLNSVFQTPLSWLRLQVGRHFGGLFFFLEDARGKRMKQSFPLGRSAVTRFITYSSLEGPINSGSYWEIGLLQIWKNYSNFVSGRTFKNLSLGITCWSRPQTSKSPPCKCWKERELPFPSVRTASLGIAFQSGVLWSRRGVDLNMGLQLWMQQLQQQ